MKRLIAILTVMLIHITATAQNELLTKSVHVQFAFDSYAIDSIKSNKTTLEDLTNEIDQLSRDAKVSIQKITIDSYCSPEGSIKYNKRLAEQRSNSIHSYLGERLDLNSLPIEVNNTGIDTKQLKELIDNDPKVPHKEEVLNIIDNTVAEIWDTHDQSINPQSRLNSCIHRLRNLHNGESYRYLARNTFKHMRHGLVLTLYFKSVAEPAIASLPTAINNSYAQDIQHFAPATPLLQTAQIAEDATSKSRGFEIALKSNLLFDAASILNIELEVPIQQRFSIAAEWIFPWWTWDDGTASSARNRIQLLNGNIEGKYWFGDRTNRARLTGWYAGLYAGGGLYDFERSAKGYQGEFFIAAGLSAGYAHTINKRGNLRMEYTLGLGYLKTDYRYYEAMYQTTDNKWYPVRRMDGNYTWIGPTRLRASLVWMFGLGNKRGGAQ